MEEDEGPAPLARRLIMGRARLSFLTAAGSALESDRHFSEAVMDILAFLLSDLSSGRIRFIEASFAHSRPDRIEEHERIFRCPLRFGAASNGIAFDEGFLSLELPGANTVLLGLLEGFASKIVGELRSPGSVMARVLERIEAALNEGRNPTIERVAGELGMGPRSLQGRLKEEGGSFREILDRFRRDIALECLKRKDASISEIAFLLGYSEQSSFNHAFKKWTGVSPRNYPAEP
jgi:AraC-like DNA-binding protein